MSDKPDNDQTLTGLLQRLLGPPREIDGSRATNRLSFQVHWGLWKTLTLHQTPRDYAVLFDFHDDIVVFEPADAPQRAEFYQVKTRTDPHWTLGTLLEADGPSGSVFGKLCLHIVKFRGYVHLVALVSNKTFGLKLTTGVPSDHLNEVSFADIDTETFDKLMDRAHKDVASIGETIEPQEAKDVVRFIVTALPLEDQETFLLGEVNKCLAKTFSHCRDQRFNSVGAYRHLCLEVERRTKFEYLHNIKNAEDLFRFKTLTRRELTDTLKEYDPRMDPEQAFQHLEPTLAQNGYSDRKRSSIRTAWRTYAARVRDPHDASIRAVREEVQRFAKSAKRDESWDSYRDLIERGVRDVLPEIEHLPLKYRDLDLLAAAVLMEFYRLEYDETDRADTHDAAPESGLQPSNSQPEEKAP
ncbi:MAG: DUF4297 domain-containing protein [Polyangiaceae bacterium]|nr:DUF4297 domain-containing protein [Polyangiaceae bacterium]